MLGDLGIRKTQDVNAALLAKKVINYPKNIPVKVVFAKYLNKVKESF